MAEGHHRKVAVLMGSASDRETMQGCLDILDYFRIPYDVHILSAHRNFREVAAFAETVEEKGIAVIIAGAGMAAHLPGVLAAQTIIPVIGVPLDGSALNGVDALYAIVQMPSGIPVATVAIGKTGAKNAAVLAAQILALEDAGLRQKLVAFRQKGSKL